MKLEFAVLADYASVSSDGKLSIGGIFDRITVSALPATQPIIFVVLRLSAHPTEFGRKQDLALSLADEDGETILRIDGVVVPDSKTRNEDVKINQILFFAPVIFKKANRHAFDLVINNQHVANLPLTIRLAPPQA